MGQAVIKGDTATVVVSMFWSGNPTASRRAVELKLTGREWKINRVTLAE